MNPFDRPIPGQSLTDEPKNNPWENPAEMSDMMEITKYYINRLANQEVIDDLATLMKVGIPLKPVVESITTAGTMRGLHTVDAAMNVGPTIHHFLKEAIESMGVEVDEDGVDYEKQSKERELERLKMLVANYLSENPDDTDPGKQMLQEVLDAGETDEEEATPEDKPMGLMAKGQ
tara:strand:+ start:101 stop:625 length:525 start_codon:yes stop_codon:yes gene_type:complete